MRGWGLEPRVGTKAYAMTGERVALLDVGESLGRCELSDVYDRLERVRSSRTAEDSSRAGEEGCDSRGELHC